MLVSAAPTHAADVKLFRFFGDCAGDYGSVTDVSKANGECGIIQALTNKFNAENKIGAKVVTQTVDWNAYYDLLSATYTTGNIPDVAIMHRSILPNFVKRDLLTPLKGPLTKAGVDFADYVPAAADAVTVGDEAYAMPFDIHALLVHVNVDLMKKAGLVDAAGDPILPKSAAELIEQGKKFKEATGKTYIGMESDSKAAMTVRVFNSLVWQQGSDLIAPDGKKATLDTEAGSKAASLVDEMYKAGLVNKEQDYAGSEQAFLNGDTGLLFNGTWGVDNYDSQAKGGKAGLKSYKVANFPNLFGTPAAWSDSHLWTVPANPERKPEVEEAAVAFLKFLNDNNFQWARTGHLSVRKSVIASEEFKKLPHRSEYAETATIAHAFPAVQNQRAIQDVMITELTSMWLAGRTPGEALTSEQQRVDQILRRNR
ncbi:ABC transporter substrate-binding protein [Rhizobium sp. Leaf384]|nr:ABC transporter substrate-binding protein [Rhizobium sp. Leaf384]